MLNEIKDDMGETKTEYQKLVDDLAREKLRNELMFQGMINAKLKEYEEKGIALPKDQLVSDINRQVVLKRSTYDLDGSLEVDESMVITPIEEKQPEIVKLNNDIDEIFDPSQIEPIDNTIPKTASFESVLSNDNPMQDNSETLRVA